MPFGQAQFDLDATCHALGQACLALICHVLFLAACYGLVLALIIAAAAVVLWKRRHKAALPLAAVSRKLVVFCLILCFPGAASLITHGHLPPVGVFQFSPLGFLVFWVLISVHLVGEEMNFQWYDKEQTSDNA